MAMIGALGLVDEGKEKFRLIHDGTHRVLIKNHMRTLDHLPSPMVSDISAETVEVEEQREAHIALVWDFKSAHRLVQVAPQDWGLQACTLADLRGKAPGPDAEVVRPHSWHIRVLYGRLLAGPPSRHGG